MALMADEKINYLADFYLALSLGTLLRITFREYLTDPEGFNQTAFYLIGGGGIHIAAGEKYKVSVH
jgi:hypothetical protein